MNRADYYNCIEERLSVLAYRIEKRSKLNILDYHIHSENFYRDFFNLIYRWELNNANTAQQNVEAIDLIDNNSHIIVQVSATNTKTKIQNSLNKLPHQRYKGFNFKFISIAKGASDLRNSVYQVPEGIVFNPTTDIYDVDLILRRIQALQIDDLKNVYDFIAKELGTETPTIQMESDLTKVIRLLAKEDLSITEPITVQQEFEISQKIDFNNLSNAKVLISEYKIYQNIVNRIYNTFDQMGQNKSLFVLNYIHKIYIQNKNFYSGDNLFNIVFNTIKNYVKAQQKVGLSEETIEMCTDILLVDTFIRCKIFENPNKQDRATA